MKSIDFIWYLWYNEFELLFSLQIKSQVLFRKKWKKIYAEKRANQKDHRKNAGQKWDKAGYCISVMEARYSFTLP